MIDEPGSFFGISNSAKPARGPHDMSLMSLANRGISEPTGETKVARHAKELKRHSEPHSSARVG